MPITLLDIVLIVVMLVSGLLAMVRGFMREVLSIIAWVLAAVATLYSYAKLLPYAKQYFNNDMVAAVAVIGGVFLVTLLVVSIHDRANLGYGAGQPRRRARPHARLPVRARARPGDRRSSPSCSSPGSFPTAASRNG